MLLKLHSFWNTHTREILTVLINMLLKLRIYIQLLEQL